MIKYHKDESLRPLMERVKERYKLNHVKTKNVFLFRSTGSKSRAIARCWSFPKIWQKALELETHYVIEVIHERFEKLNEYQKEEVMLHELLHIPKSFGGGLRNHSLLLKERKKLR